MKPSKIDRRPFKLWLEEQSKQINPEVLKAQWEMETKIREARKNDEHPHSRNRNTFT